MSTKINVGLTKGGRLSTANNTQTNNKNAKQLTIAVS